MKDFYLLKVSILFVCNKNNLDHNQIKTNLTSYLLLSHITLYTILTHGFILTNYNLFVFYCCFRNCDA